MKSAHSYHITPFILALLFAALMPFLSSCGHEGKQVGSAKDLQGAVIGVQLGTTADLLCSDLEKQGHGTRVERFTKSADAIQALLQGKIDCIVDDEQPMKAFARQNPSLCILDDPFGGDSLAFCFGKDKAAKRLQQRVDSALQVMRQNGLLHHIVSTHLDGSAAVAYTPRNTPRHGRPLTVATNATFPPYEYYDHGKIVGTDIDIMRAVADILGCEVVFRDMNFDAVLTSVQTGKADIGAAGITATPDRRANMRFSSAYTYARTTIMVLGQDAVASKGLMERLHDDFISEGRYAYLLQGLGNTLLITLFASILSVVLGTLVAIVRATHDRTGRLPITDFLCKVYLALLRGTPTMVQLLIIYYVIFATVDVSKVFVAIVAFGINSSAYLAEVVRGGIMSIDRGQMEAGRSLGLSHWQTMRLVILPQAFRNVLPAMGNEIITLLKETSIAGYIGLVDLTKGSDIIRSITYDAMLPLTIVAAIYFLMVCLLALGINRLERKLRHQ